MHTQDAYADAYTDTYTNTYTNAYTDAYTDAYIDAHMDALEWTDPQPPNTNSGREIKINEMRVNP